MGFGFQTPISWQAEMWVLRNAKGGIATKKGGCWPMQGIWNAPLGNKKIIQKQKPKNKNGKKERKQNEKEQML